MESRKSKLESRGINKNSFYKNRKKNPDKLPNSKSPANSYFNNPSKAGLPSIGKDSPGDYKNISKYSVSKRGFMKSGERNQSLPSNKNLGKYVPTDNGDSGSILNKYYNNNQGMTGAQNYNPVGGLSKAGGGLSKPTVGNSDAYGVYPGAGGGLGGGLVKKPRKDSSAAGDKPPAYGGYNYGGGGISKYSKNKEDNEHLPSVTNRQALGSGVSIGSRRNIGANLGSKEGSRGNIPSGGGLGGYGSLSRKKDSNSELPNLNKYSGGGLGGGLGSLNKGGLNKGGLSGLGGGLSSGGGLGRYNL